VVNDHAAVVVQVLDASNIGLEVFPHGVTCKVELVRFKWAVWLTIVVANEVFEGLGCAQFFGQSKFRGDHIG
jgi:hypothetical protein